MASVKKLLHRLLDEGGGHPELITRRTEIILIVAISLLAVLSHLPLLFGNFVEYDDGSHIFRNPIVQDLTWNNFKEVLFSNFMGRASSPSFALHMLNWKLGGGAYSAFAAVNLLWLVIGTLVFYRFSALFLGGKGARLFATALFAVHSVNVDTIAWMSARCHFFGATYVIISFVFWQKYLDEIYRPKRVLFYGLAFAAAGLAMWSKGLFVVIGPLLCVFDVYRRRRLTPLAVMDKIPFAAVAVIPFMHPPISVNTDAFAQPSIGPTVTHTLMNDATLFVEYILRGIVPGPTTIDVSVYPQEGLFDISSSDTVTMMAFPPIFNIGVILLIFGACFWMMKRFRLRQPFFALIFAAVSLLPVMNIPPRWVEFAFRFIFLPSIFLSIAVGALSAYAWHRAKGMRGRIVIVVTSAVLLGAHLVQTVKTSATWRNNFTYWDNCVTNFPDAITCRLKLALDHHDHGRTDEMLEEYKKMVHLSTTRHPKRDHTPAYHLGREYSRLEDKENACFYFRYAQITEQLNSGYRDRAREYIRKNCH